MYIYLDQKEDFEMILILDSSVLLTLSGYFFFHPSMSLVVLHSVEQR